MDESERSELADLRRRAYGRGGEEGRGAEAGLDAPARARLRLLEERAATGGQARPVVVDPVPRRAAARIGRRAVVLWAASLVLTAAAVLAAASWFSSAADADVAVLPLNATQRWAGSGFAEAVATDDFSGLTVVRSEGGGPADDPDLCLLVVATAPSDGNVLVDGCSAGSFPATAQLTVASGMPDALVARFGEGRGLRFTLDGDTVTVQTDAP
ncbi:hypothetical protein [Rathayibacter sp. VKM Ac-2760]|uniref:hypothetical protein n=1 Tax=Rathayibacter sp. VKM Ac-2760 TaxID=2609253 RepID=UPI001317D075|nr:hypothetical protein [Rathayibacter sp. VKM Ac-2760]QHC58866.1 hypothetical protein GSU72_10140 [Rathayibacter sp. VKM Ac-2760]